MRCELLSFFDISYICSTRLGFDIDLVKVVNCFRSLIYPIFVAPRSNSAVVFASCELLSFFDISYICSTMMFIYTFTIFVVNCFRSLIYPIFVAPEKELDVTMFQL